MHLVSTDCLLCRSPGGRLVAQSPRWRLVRVEGAEAEAFPAFYRLVWQTHVAEFSELNAAERHDCMEAVAAVEATLRAALGPCKINLASLGNVVPHLHWHVVARFEWDSHYPNPIWGKRQREVEGGALARMKLSPADLDARLRQAMHELANGEQATESGAL